MLKYDHAVVDTPSQLEGAQAVQPASLSHGASHGGSEFKLRTTWMSRAELGASLSTLSTGVNKCDSKSSSRCAVTGLDSESDQGLSGFKLAFKFKPEFNLKFTFVTQQAAEYRFQWETATIRLLPWHFQWLPAATTQTLGQTSESLFNVQSACQFKFQCGAAVRVTVAAFWVRLTRFNPS